MYGSSGGGGGVGGDNAGGISNKGNSVGGNSAMGNNEGYVNNRAIGDNSDSDGFSVVRRGSGGLSSGGYGEGKAPSYVVNSEERGQSSSMGGDGLNPNRQKGFNWQGRIETPTLNDMKAKQGAIVSKFMTFSNRKNTAMIELYERAFYNKRPGWDSLANFVYNDLCPSDVLRQSVEDVQFHPVKMIIFIKFKNEGARNCLLYTSDAADE